MAVFKCNFISYTLNRSVDLQVIIPTISIPDIRHKEKLNHEIKDKYPVLYLLHGYGNNCEQWIHYSKIELYAEERQIAIVCLSGENKFYLNNENDKFYDFIENELPSFITNIFPISTKKEDTYIAGLSMGGFGALFHGLSNPRKYHAIGAFSPAIETRNNQSLYSIDITKETPKIFMSCGEDDFLYDKDKEFSSYLKDKGTEYYLDKRKRL